MKKEFLSLLLPIVFIVCHPTNMLAAETSLLSGVVNSFEDTTTGVSGTVLQTTNDVSNVIQTTTGTEHKPVVDTLNNTLDMVNNVVSTTLQTVNEVGIDDKDHADTEEQNPVEKPDEVPEENQTNSPNISDGGKLPSDDEGSNTLTTNKALSHQVSNNFSNNNPYQRSFTEEIVDYYQVTTSKSNEATGKINQHSTGNNYSNSCENYLPIVKLIDIGNKTNLNPSSAGSYTKVPTNTGNLFFCMFVETDIAQGQSGSRVWSSLDRLVDQWNHAPPSEPPKALFSSLNRII